MQYEFTEEGIRKVANLNGRRRAWLLFACSLAMIVLAALVGLHSATDKAVVIVVGAVASSVALLHYTTRQFRNNLAVSYVPAWLLTVATFVITRQHWWRAVGIFVVTLLVGWLAIMLAKHVWTNGWIGRIWQSLIVKPAKAVYTVFVGHPRYWYKVGDHLKYTESFDEMSKAAFQPAYVYLPKGGIFRRCRIVWPGNHWRIARKRLGFRGYRLVDSEGESMAIRLGVDFFAGTPKPILIVGRSITELGRKEAGDNERIVSRIFSCKSVTCAFDDLLHRLDSDEMSIRTLKSVIASAEDQSAKSKAENAARQQALAKRLARITALVKAAPKHKKLGVARHELTAMIQELVNDEKQAKALLMDALDELERAEASPAQN